VTAGNGTTGVCWDSVIHGLNHVDVWRTYGIARKDVLFGLTQLD